MKQKIFTLLFVLLATTSSLFAESIKIGDLYYNLDETSKTAYVTFSSQKYIGDIVIPSSVIYNNETFTVTHIGNYAFSECAGLTSITISNSVTSIGPRAFSKCVNLSSIIIPNNVTSIGNNAFYECSGLTSVIISNNVTNMGKNVFIGCSSLPVENNIRYADTYLIEAVDKTLSLYTIKEGTRWIESHAFSECARLASITIPNSVTSIGERAFYKCTNLLSITIPNNVTSIGDYAFYGCNNLPVINNIRYADTYLVGAVDQTLSSYTIKEGTKWIGSDAFLECTNLASITIPNSVTSIGEEAFSVCHKLTSVTIPNSVTSIGYKAFAGCRSLTSFYNYASTPQEIDGAFRETNTSACTLYVPEGSLEAYKAADEWKEFGNIIGIQAPEGIDEIKPSTLYDKSQKRLRDGHILIQQGENVYTVTGQKIN